jgi:F-type H+-transporting ATPase subunit delta
MRHVIVASRYAKSLLQLAGEQGVEDTTYEAMKLVAKSCEENKELDLLLKSPIVKAHKKMSILGAIFKGKLNELSLEFINIITGNRREGFLYEIALEYQDQYKARKAIVTATVTTANGLDADMKSAVLNLIKKSEHSEVEMIERTDEDLIGGLILRIGDKQYDGSIQRSLNDLKQEFKNNTYIVN